MLEQVVRRELDDSWGTITEGLLSDDSRSVISNEPIAEHNSGAELYVDVLDATIPVWRISVTQPVVYNNIIATPITISEQIQDKQYIAKFIRDVCNGIADDSNTVEAIGFVPHSGSIDSVDFSYLSEDAEINIDQLPEFVDLFCVYPASLPGRITVDDVRSVSDDMVKMVYGEYDEESRPETINELSSNAEAYGDVRLETFTVPTDELEQTN